MEELVAGPWDGVFQAKVRKSPGYASGLLLAEEGESKELAGP